MKNRKTMHTTFYYTNKTIHGAHGLVGGRACVVDVESASERKRRARVGVKGQY